jgi:hypothetical protein
MVSSLDRGVSWTVVAFRYARGFKGILALAIDPREARTLYASVSSAGVFKSGDRGESWTATGLSDTTCALDPDCFESPHNYQSLTVDPRNSQTLYAGAGPGFPEEGQGGVHKSEDGGTSWTLVGLTDHFVNILAIDPLTPQRLYACPYESGVHRSDDGGSTWTEVSAGLPVTQVRSLVVSDQPPRRLYAGTAEGVFESRDAGASWTAVNAGLTDTSVYALVLDSRAPPTLYAGTDAGVFSMSFPVITAVREEPADAIPQSTGLDQNYPNPFNSSTVIRYALRYPDRVELAVYNLAGQKVATLVEGPREAGSYRVHWDGRDGEGRAVASGLYVYRLRTGDGNVSTRRLVLVR